MDFSIENIVETIDKEIEKHKKEIKMLKEYTKEKAFLHNYYVKMGELATRIDELGSIKINFQVKASLIRAEIDSQ